MWLGQRIRQRRADAAFGRREIRTVEEAAGAAAGEMILGAVVAAHHHDGVVGNAEFVELVEQHAEVMVEHQEAVAPVAVVALADEFVARAHREVHQRVIEVAVERLVVLDRLLHELEGALLVFEVAGLLGFHGELLVQQRSAALALEAFVHVGKAVALRHVMRIRRPHAFVVGAQRAVPFVEAVVGREAAVFGADVPLAVDRRGIAGFRQDRCDGALPGDDAAAVAAERDGVVAGPDREASGHQRRTGRRALRLDDIMGELGAFLGEGVHAHGIGAAQLAAAVAAQFSHAEVVDVEEQNVWFLGHW